MQLVTIRLDRLDWILLEKVSQLSFHEVRIQHTEKVTAHVHKTGNDLYNYYDKTMITDTTQLVRVLHMHSLRLAPQCHTFV